MWRDPHLTGLAAGHPPHARAGEGLRGHCTWLPI